MSKSPKDAALPGLLAELNERIDSLAAEATSPPSNAQAQRRLETGLREIAARIEGVIQQLHPIKQPGAVFDPSNPKIVGRFIALAMVAQERLPLANIDKFYGSGVYAIYYRGRHPLYNALSKSETPIYVGQASPNVANARTPTEQGAKLSARLLEHSKNIQRASASLDLNDFDYRTLVIQSGWETAAEDYLIHLFRPIWNSETNLVYGLGKHGDDAKTRANKRSPWDTIHPGRPWAGKSEQDAKSPQTISDEVVAHFLGHRVFKTVHEVLDEFLAELKAPR
jgi:Eco29kI restriction endonuclease